MDRSKKFLSDILTSISLIEEFTKNNSSYDEYDKDIKTQSAVERQLMVWSNINYIYDV